MPAKALVVDANILVRAVLGKRLREVIETYAEQVSFFVPEVAFADAEEHLPAVVTKHGGNPGKALAFLHTLGRLVEVILWGCHMDLRPRRHVSKGMIGVVALPCP